MDRRVFLLTAAAAGVAAALGACAGAGGPGAATAGSTPAQPHPDPPVGDGGALQSDTAGAATSGVAAPDLGASSVSPSWPVLQTGAPSLTAPVGGPPKLIDRLPGIGQNVALTIDDGVSPQVVRAYCDLARATGIRLTFFVTGSYPSWTLNRDALRPLVDAGQVQLGNHTWTHPALTRLGPAAATSEITRCERFLVKTFGVTGKPFLRPPFGAHSTSSDALAAGLGYTAITMWYGSFGDSGLLTADVLLGEARRWLNAQAVVLGHANYPTVTTLYGQLVDLLRERALQTVTLDDAFYGPAGRPRAATPAATDDTRDLAPGPQPTGAPTQRTLPAQPGSSPPTAPATRRR